MRERILVVEVAPVTVGSRRQEQEKAEVERQKERAFERANKFRAAAAVREAPVDARAQEHDKEERAIEGQVHVANRASQLRFFKEHHPVADQ
jgi:hypothetical protein